MSKNLSKISQANISENKSKFESKFDSKFLAEGGNGEVFEATEKGSGKKFAIKKMILTKESSKQFEREKKFKYLDHPNIVRYYDSWDDGKYQYIQMELCKRDNLADWLKKSDETTRKAQYISIFLQIVRAVKHLHSIGFMHRDLKVNIKFIKKFSKFLKKSYIKNCIFSPKIY